jgi:hypothetical protein
MEIASLKKSPVRDEILVKMKMKEELQNPRGMTQIIFEMRSLIYDSITRNLECLPYEENTACHGQIKGSNNIKRIKK